MALNLKQLAFAEEYMVDANATRAAMRAGYSERTAAQQGSRLLKHVEVAAYLEELRQQRAARTAVDADRVILELARLGLSDLRDVAEWGPDYLDFRESWRLEDYAAAAVREVKFERERRYTEDGEPIDTTKVGVKLHDKLGALKLLAEHTGVLSQTPNLGELAESFLAGVNHVRGQAPADMSE